MDIIKKKRAEAVNRIISKGYLSTKRVYVGMATCEIAAGSKEVMAVFHEAVARGLTDVYLSQKGCAGRCNLEPTVEVVEEGRIPVKYGKVTPARAREIVERHIGKHTGLRHSAKACPVGPAGDGSRLRDRQPGREGQAGARKRAGSDSGKQQNEFEVRHPACG